MKDLNSNVYRNPHSQSDSSSGTCDIIQAARQQVLDYFNASSRDYKCIFTSGATAALKLVGETFPWSRSSSFMYTMENHNSVLGIREYALSQGAVASAIDIEEVEHQSGVSGSSLPSFKVSHPLQRRNGTAFLDEASGGDVYNLFAFPSECNFTGTKFSLDLVKIMNEDSERILAGSQYCKGRWMVLIDAAKGCATQPPDLTEFPADFVVISFYKIFGYPTGLGALIIRTEAAKLLKKTYFSGGTVAASIADIDFVRRRESIEGSFEDGTVSFLSIASIQHGFRVINTLSVSAIARHTASLATYVRNMLVSLRHINGAEVCKIYGRKNEKVPSYELGPTVAFNLKQIDGSWVGYREVEKLASLSGIQLRTGCFCNPGACAKYLGLSHQDLLSNIEAGHICWDDNDVLHGKPTGAVRVSFGYMSTFEDANKFIRFIESSFVSRPNQTEDGYSLRAMSHPLSRRGFGQRLSTSGVYLKSITIYPIKSCAGFNVESWPLSTTGLQYDREWLLKSPSGEILTQKKVPEMCLISTFIDLTQRILFVESPRCKLKLQIEIEAVSHTGVKEEMDLRAQRYEVQGYDSEIDLWFSNALARPCTLLRCSSSKYDCYLNKNGSMGACRDVESKLTFVNEGQILLISEQSISDLNQRLSSNVQDGNCRQRTHVDPMRFRPNLVVSGGEPYAEDSWRSLKIGKNHFTSLGGCNRCQMINRDPKTGQMQKSKEPLATLSSYRRMKGKILFGILLRYESTNTVGVPGMDSWLQVGPEVYLDSS